MWRALPGLVFLLAVSMLLYSTYLKATKPQSSELIGLSAPNIHTTALEGYPAIPQDTPLYGHGYVLVNFFASWCAPCLAEHPYLVQLSHDYDLTIIGVVWRDAPSNVRAMLEAHGNPYDYIGIDLMDATAFGFSVKGLPESFLIDPQGKVAFTHRGPLTPAILREELTPLLEDNTPMH